MAVVAMLLATEKACASQLKQKQKDSFNMIDQSLVKISEDLL